MYPLRWIHIYNLPQGCTIVSWLLLSCLCVPSLPWLATVHICPLELREGPGGWRGTEGFPCPGPPQGLAQFLSFNLIFIFGCIGSSLLHVGFLYLRRAGATLRCDAQASHCGGFSCCRAWALGARASVVAAHGLSSCGSRALECRLSSWGAWS